MNRKGAIGVVAVAGLVAGIGHVLMPVDVVPPMPVAEAPKVSRETGGTLVPLPGSIGPRNASVAPPEDDGKGWFHTDSATTVAARYRAMGDKRRFWDLALKAGGGAHLHFARQAGMKCGRVSGKPGASAAPANALKYISTPDERMLAQASMYAGCEGFESRPIDERDESRLYDEMDVLADPVARAYRLERTRGDANLVRAELAALLAEGDLHVARIATGTMRELTVGPSPMRSWDRKGPPPIDTPANERFMVEQEAWELAWCRVGIECEKGDSILWHNACISGGFCGEDYAEAYARSRVAPGSHKALESRSREIESAIRDRNWKALGFQ